MASPIRTVRIGTHRWTVVLSDEVERPELKGREGLCVYGNNELLLDRHVEKNRLKATYLHELGHASAESMGLIEIIIAATGLSRARAEKIEEAILCSFIPSFVSAMDFAGFLKQGFIMLRTRKERKVK